MTKETTTLPEVNFNHIFEEDDDDDDYSCGYNSDTAVPMECDTAGGGFRLHLDESDNEEETTPEEPEPETQEEIRVVVSRLL